MGVAWDEYVFTKTPTNVEALIVHGGENNHRIMLVLSSLALASQKKSA